MQAVKTFQWAALGKDIWRALAAGMKGLSLKENLTGTALKVVLCCGTPHVSNLAGADVVSVRDAGGVVM